MKTLFLIISALALNVFGFSSTAYAADAAKGAEYMKKNNCAACHGADYVKSTDASIPKLAGQHQDYLVQALRQYRAGDSKTAALARNNAIMTGQAKAMSLADIDNISAYFASLKGDLLVRK